MGHLTKLSKPTMDPNNFEDSFSDWEYDVSRFEKDNNTTLPDQMKVAILLNETTKPLQQHLASAATGWNKPDIHGNQRAHHRVLQSNHSIQQDPSNTSAKLEHGQELHPRSRTNGHRSH